MTTSEPVGITDDTFDLMGWIESGTIARRQVTIYNDHEAAAQLAAVDAEIAAARTTRGAVDDRPLDMIADDTDLGQLLARRDELVEQVAASGAIWTVRALSQDDVDASFDPDRGGVAEPKRPVPPLEKAGQKAQDRFATDVASWQARRSEADRQRRLVQIATAVESVENVRGTVRTVTAAHLQAMLGRPHGAQAIEKLWLAVNAATDEDVDVPRPTSREGYTSTPA